MGTKRKLKLSDSARKKARVLQRNLIQSTRIVLRNQNDRWQAVKEENGFKTNEETAKFLIDCYRKQRQRFSTPRVNLARTEQGELDAPTASSIDSQTETASTISGCELLMSSQMETTHDYTETPRKMETAEPTAGTSQQAHSELSSDTGSSDPTQIKDISMYSPGSSLDAGDSGVNSRRLMALRHAGQINPRPCPSNQALSDEENSGRLQISASSSIKTDDDEQRPSTSKKVVKGVVKVESAEDLLLDTCCITYGRSLELLWQHAPRGPCSVCQQPLSVNNKKRGTALYLNWICPNGHLAWKWCSQPRLRAKGVHAADFSLAANILLSGNNFAKVALLIDFCKIGNLTRSFHDNIQALYTCPVIEDYWTSCVENVREERRGSDLVLAGDGRNDSPGHTAQFCTYTFMDHDTKQIIGLYVVDKREVKLKSVNMERFAFEKGMQELLDAGMNIKEVVTDASPQIGATMKKDFPEVKHSWDVWHGAKNFGKKVTAAAMDKQCKDLAPWTRDLINHFWYCAEKSKGSTGAFLALWRGMLHHVVNSHEWLLGDSGGPGKCAHEDIEEEDREKAWLLPDSPAHIRLRQLVLDKRLLGTLQHYVHFRHTGFLEAFHNLILMYAAKRFSFTYEVYRARNLMAAIDYQSHKDRATKKNQDGSDKKRRVYSKRSGNWSAVPVKVNKSYPYITDLQTKIINTCLADTRPLKRKRILPQDHPQRIRRVIAPITPPPTKDLIKRHKSRFAAKDVAPSQDTDASSSGTVLYSYDSSN